MDDTEHLYQELILDHYRHPRHRTALANDEVLVEMENPLCGDQIKLHARMEQGRIADLQFDGHGCVISQASASIMCDRLIGMTGDAARREIESFLQAMRGEADFPHDAPDALRALSGVKKFPLRVKCATLSWQGLDQWVQSATAPDLPPDT